MTVCMMFRTANAQMVFQIEEISLSYYDNAFNNNVIDEDLRQGPYVFIKCLIINSLDTALVIEPAKSTVKITFRYNSSDYEVEAFSLPFQDIEELTIYSKDSVDLSFGQYLLLGTEIFEYEQGDYTKEMLSILPTLKVVYQDEKIKMYSSEIKNVIIKK